MRRRGAFSGGAIVALVVIGCNAILENEPGRLDRDDGETPARPIGGGPSGDPVNEAGADESDASPGAGETEAADAADAADAREAPCAAGMKACAGLCVSKDDPFFGCGGEACARCETPNATATCALGACAVGACVPGFADCNASPLDGCETSLATVTDCGACGVACPTAKNVEMACVEGACVGTCAPGFGDCNGKAQDGCERDLLTDKRHCGACGTRCVFGRCEDGVCTWP